MKIPLYKFNKGNMQYEKIVLNGKKILIFFVIQILLSIGIIFGLSHLFNTPKEGKLKRENTNLKYDLHVMDKKIDGIYYFIEILEQKDSAIISAFGVEIDSVTFPTPETIDDKLGNIIMILKYTERKFNRILADITSNDIKLRHYPAIRPVSAKDLLYISSGFSMRVHPIYHVNKFHYGMDFVAEVGTPVYATADGTVVMAQNYLGYGNFIKIDHGDGVATAYAHLDDIGVKSNQKVVRGEIIGTLGNTGISTGPHLHYEVIYKNRPVNPINFYSQDITAEEYEMMLRVTKTLRVGMD